MKIIDAQIVQQLLIYVYKGFWQRFYFGKYGEAETVSMSNGGVWVLSNDNNPNLL
jgi:hypothetical protein